MDKYRKKEDQVIVSNPRMIKQMQKMQESGKTKEEIDQFVIDATQNQTCMETRMLNYKFVH